NIVLNPSGTNVMLDISGRANGKLTLNSGQTLSGGNAGTFTGIINGSVSNAPGATIAPGVGGIGILTVTNGNVNLNGTTAMDLNKTSATNDMLAVTGNLIFGGTLSLN